MAFVNEERKKYTIYPPAEDVFSWTLCCPIQKVMLVLKINVKTNIIWNIRITVLVLQCVGASKALPSVYLA